MLVWEIGEGVKLVNLCSSPSPKRFGETDTSHSPETMLNIITSSVSDSLAIPLGRDRSCPEYKVVIPPRKDRQCRIRKAKRRNFGKHAN